MAPPKKRPRDDAAKRTGHGSGIRGGEMFKFRTDEFIIVGLDTKDGPEHYLFDATAKDPPTESLVESIIKYGVLIPVEFERDGDRVLVVDGRNRVKAARIALARMREAAVKEGADPKKVELLIRGIPVKGTDVYLAGVMHASNAGRRIYGHREERQAVQHMLGHGADDLTICATLQITRAQLKERKAILGMAAPVLAAIDAGQVSPTAAATWAPLAKAEQVKALEETTKDGAKPTVERAANKAREATGRAPIETARGRIAKISAALDELAAEWTQLGALVELTEDERAAQAMTTPSHAAIAIIARIANIAGWQPRTATTDATQETA